ncbi:heat shock 70 kDa 17 [Olea europaea subsp. europaea]|uniref:Heat shock 70 kDa 17 n=1 Tax=Olea europaea subsp. europaea TaxID=158383 RepID=A0A8S0RRS3_OLEEU|nr:heat shock 70 kDa 17 [Olea europaea subsp. europaea]
MSKRKTPSLVAFHANSRLIDEESLGLLARYPTKVHSHLPILLSKPYNYTQKFRKSLYLSYDITLDEIGTLRLRNGACKESCKSSVKDLVITVPSYIGVAERRGLLTAVDLAGINVLALVNEH